MHAVLGWAMSATNDILEEDMRHSIAAIFGITDEKTKKQDSLDTPGRQIEISESHCMLVLALGMEGQSLKGDQMARLIIKVKRS